MNNTQEQVHKLSDDLMTTACGLNIVAIYPLRENYYYAMTDEAGKANVKVSLKKGVTCKACKEKVKNE